LTREELDAWLESKSFGEYVGELQKVTAKILGDASVTEADIAEFGEFPSIVRRQLVAAIKDTVANGVKQVSEEAEEEGREGEVVDVARSTLKSAVSGVTAEAAHTAVWSSLLSRPHFAVSFYFALISVRTALDAMAWWGDGTMTVHGFLSFVINPGSQ